MLRAGDFPGIAEPGPSAGEMPPDQQAYTEANKIADPEKKIAPLGKLKTDFPASMRPSPTRRS